jgi:hypothetical protein
LGDYLGWLFLLFWPGLFLIFWIGDWAAGVRRTFKEHRRKSALYDERVAELTQLDAYRDRLAREREAIGQIVEQKTVGFPWLAQAFSDFYYLRDMQESNALRYKKHPAKKAADRVKEIANARRDNEKELRITRYLLQYYESLFPWLVDLRGEDVDDLVEQSQQPTAEDVSDDPARKWLTAGEYSKLSTSQRYQLALDRYWSRKKTSWEVGRDYERYIGYLYESEGYSVHYQGIVEGFADLGRDLIATKEAQTVIVQCKCWSRDKTIHEKHVFQLFGTLTAYRVDHPGQEVTARFTTSTVLSERARLFSAMLGIEVQENLPLARYPCIKCNISGRNRERIYHLPFDQQYDRTLVEEEKLERFVETVQEAEMLGFRRARRWRGEAVSAGSV